MKKIKVTKIAHFSGHKDCIYGLGKSYRDNSFYTGGADGLVVEWNYESKGDGRLIVKVGKPVYSFLPCRETSRLLIGTSGGNLHVIDLDNNSEVRNIEAHKAGIFDIKEIPSRKLVVTAGGDGALHFWNSESLDFVKSIKPGEKSARIIAVKGDETEMAVGFSDHTIRVYDLATLEEKLLISGHTNSVFSLAYSPDNKILVSGGRDAHLRIWDCNDGYRNIINIPAHLYHINFIDFNPDGSLFATASLDKTLKIWNAADFSLLKVIDKERNEAHINSVNKALWIDSNRFISCSDDKTAMVFQISS